MGSERPASGQNVVVEERHFEEAEKGWVVWDQNGSWREVERIGDDWVHEESGASGPTLHLRLAPSATIYMTGARTSIVLRRLGTPPFVHQRAGEGEVCGDELYTGVRCELAAGHEGRCAMRGVRWIGRSFTPAQRAGEPTPEEVRAGTVEPTYAQLRDDCDGVVIQRDDMRERLDRIRAAAESDPGLPSALRDFLLTETQPGWLHVTPEMVERLRATGSHHPVDARAALDADRQPEGEDKANADG